MTLLLNRFSRCIVFATFATLALTRAGNAENLYLAGFTANDDEDYYGYIGAVLPAFGSTLDDDGWRVRLWGSYTAFEYEGKLAGGAAGVPTTFEGDGPSGSLALGYRHSFTPNLTSTTYIGGVWRDFEIDPNDPGSEVEDDNVAVLFQQELDYLITSNIDVSLIGSLNGGYDESYWGRIRPGFMLGNGWKVGPEVVLIGGEVFDKQRYGVFVSGARLGNLGIGASLGLEQEASTSDDAFYGGLSFSLRY